MTLVRPILQFVPAFGNAATCWAFKKRYEFSGGLTLFCLTFSLSLSPSLPLGLFHCLFFIALSLFLILLFYFSCWFSLFFFAVEAKVLDNNLVLVPGHGLQGKVWFKGCLDSLCMTYPVWLEVSVWKKDQTVKIIKTGSIRPGLAPFPVNGLLLLSDHAVNDMVTVRVQYGFGILGSTYPHGEDLESKSSSVACKWS